MLLNSYAFASADVMLDSSQPNNAYVTVQHYFGEGFPTLSRPGASEN